MSDFYSEWIIKRKTPAKTNAIKMVLYVLDAIALVASFMIPIVGLIIVAVLVLVTWVYIKNSDVEWEYSIVQKELTIDKIMSKAKRKRMGEFDLTKVEVCAPSDHYEIKAYDNRNLKVLDYTSLEPDRKTYTAVLMHNNELTKLVFEPTDGMLKELGNIIPRQLKKN